MRGIFKREVIEFITPCGTKKWIILRELCQYFLEFVIMHETEMTRVNGVKDV